MSINARSHMAEDVQSDIALPKDKVDVVVIGAGIIGVTAAFYLAQQGKRVVLLDKGRVGAEQSSRNWGWCRHAGRSLPEVPLSLHSLQLWSEMDHLAQHPTGFKRPGSLVVSRREQEVGSWEKWIDDTRELHTQCRVLSPAEVKQKLPGAAESYVGGFYSAIDGYAEPSMAAPAIARAAQALGVILLQDCAARGMETRAGAISAVVTERGVIETETVLCAGGAWSSMFCRHHGIALPQASVYASACRTTPMTGLMDGAGAVSNDSYAFRQRADGGYTLALKGSGRVDITPQGLKYARRFLPLFYRRRKNLTLGIGKSFVQGPQSLQTWKNDQVSPFEQLRIMNPTPDRTMLLGAFEAFQRAYPAMKDARIAQAWGGLIDSTPDSLPVISPVAKLPGFFLATGFSGLGFGLGPASGHMAASLILGKSPVVNPQAFRYERFFDGSVAKPSAHL